jgi:hypothetical protein
LGEREKGNNLVLLVIPELLGNIFSSPRWRGERVGVRGENPER